MGMLLKIYDNIVINEIRITVINIIVDWIMTVLYL